jgi:hypothetical protein
MVFFSSPALHGIRRLVRLICNHSAELRNTPRTTPLVGPDFERHFGPEFPDPTHFIDSTMAGKVPGTMPGAAQADTRQKRSRHPTGASSV